MGERLKEREIRILSELMKNSRQSDREIAHKLEVSQPTVSRARARLEKQGYIREYTAIPEFSKLGYKIMAITFGRSRSLSEEEADRLRKIFVDHVRNEQSGLAMLKRGLGLGYDGVLITYHKNYTSYRSFSRWLKQALPKELVDVKSLDSFLIDLDDKVTHLPFTLSLLADELLQAQRSNS